MADAAQRLRWDTVEQESALPGLGQRITHPEFAATEFVHVRAKSLLNHVPAAAGMPFEWTINTYRGCTHACTYCAAPETPVMLADGHTRQIQHLRKGDAILGTRLVSGRRVLVDTTVDDHWQTTKRAYAVTLADGRRLVASADHRFLADGGWRYVRDVEGRQRSGLTPGARLVGVATFAMPGATVRSGPELLVVGIEDLGVEIPMYDITTGTGDFIANGVVSHNCFARPTHTYLDLDAGRDFESVIVVKINAVERLRAELRKPSWGGHHVALGTNTDPYQRCEGRYRLTRGVIETLTEAGNPYSLLTKGTLVTRDLDVLADAARRGVCTGVSMSIPTLDEDVWRGTEPGTPNPRRRLEAIAALHDAGIPTGVMVAPIIPGISDAPDQLEAVVKGAVEAGADRITPIVLHLRPGVREQFLPWLERERPDLLERYRRLYPRSYAPKVEQQRISRLLYRLADRHGGNRGRRVRGEERLPAPAVPASPPRPEQLALL